MTVSGVADSTSATVQAQRRQQETQQTAAPPPQTPTTDVHSVGATPPTVDVGAAQERNEVAGQKWDDFRGTGAKIDAARHLDDKDHDSLYAQPHTDGAGAKVKTPTANADLPSAGAAASIVGGVATVDASPATAAAVTASPPTKAAATAADAKTTAPAPSATPTEKAAAKPTAEPPAQKATKPPAPSPAAATTPAAKTGLAKTLEDHPRIKTNQDLINHYYRHGGGTWEGASRLARSEGASLTQMARNRRKSPVPAAPPKTSTDAATMKTAPAAPTTNAPATSTTKPLAPPTKAPADSSSRVGADSHATKAASPAPKPEGVGRSMRTFRDVDQAKLEAALPDNAKHLARAFIEEGRKNNLDPVVLAAISKFETGNFSSRAFKHKNNAMGISNRHGPTMQESAEASIAKMATSLANPDGYYGGKDTIGEVAGVYAPEDAENDPNGTNNQWGGSVARIADQLDSKVRPTAASR